MEPVFDCWEVLDLPARSDERSIKRQYARLLKVRRPDEDPVAFQQLREAYEQALQILREGPDKVHKVAADVTAASITQHRPHPNLTPTRSLHEQAVELLSGFEDQAVDRYWTEASARGCNAEFERLLFQRCVDDPEAHWPLLSWGLEQRQWLTPWQQIPASEFHQQQLIRALTAALYRKLDHLLASGEQEYFLDFLEHHSRQPWLGDFARRQALQVQVLNLFLNTEDWSAQLFQRVCQLFAWDVEAAVVPIAEDQWQALHRRCEQQAWLGELRSLMQQRQQHPSACANAAALFLLSTQPAQQAELALGFVEADWQACEQLAETFATRFPDLLGMFPNHDPWFWKALIGHKDPPYGVKRAACVLTIALALNNLGSSGLIVLLMLPLYALGGWVAAQVGKWLLSHWTTLTENLYDLDLRASEWCVRHKLTADRRYLVIRNGGPLLALALVIWNWLGVLGLATYVITGVIGLLQPASAVPTDRQYRWRKPLQAIYRIAGLSRLQWLFCLLMVLVIGYVQLHMPGTLLTQGRLR
ncbi:hypothetical protein D3C78_569450 [compost metagenome]